MKALILTTHTGGGHDACAAAIAEAWTARGNEALVRDCVAYAGQWASRAVCDGYVKLVRAIPREFGRVYRLGSRVSNPHLKSPIYAINAAYAFRMRQEIETFQPDVIVCTHLYAGQSVTHLRRKGWYRGPLVMVMTDYTIHPFTEDVEMDALVLASPELTEEALGRSIPSQRLFPSGIPVSLQCVPCADQAAAKRAVGLSAELPEVLLVGGYMGAGDLPGDIEALLTAHPTARITAVCGSNARAKVEAEHRFSGNPRVTVRGTVSPLAPLMQAADVLVTKAGGLSVTEAMHIGVPLVILRPIEGCETANADFCERHGAARWAHTPEELKAAVAALLADPEARARMREAQHRAVPQDSAQACTRLMDTLIKGAET